MAYLGDIYLGETQKASVIYDTGSGWLTVSSAECDSTCKSKAYDRTKSANSKVVDGNIKTLNVIKMVWISKSLWKNPLRQRLHSIKLIMREGFQLL
jgi:Eukaryotic aspartyl protease